MKQMKQKPWYRLRNIFFTFVFVIFIFLGWAFLEVWKVYKAEPKPRIDYRAKLRQMAEDNAGISAEDADKSWLLFVEAMDKFAEAQSLVNAQRSQSNFKSRGKSDDGDVDFGYPLCGNSLPDDVDREKQCLQKISDLGVYQLLDEFTQTSNIGLRPVTGSGPLINDTLQYAAWARGFAKSQAALIRISVAEGDLNQIVSALKHTLSLAESLSYQPTIVEYMVAVSMVTLVFAELQYTLIESNLSSETYSALENILEDFSPSSVAFSLECERELYHDLADWVFTDDGDGNGYMISTLSDWSFAFNHKEKSFSDAIKARFYLATKQETLTEIDNLIDWLITESKIVIRKESLNNQLIQRMVELNKARRYPFIPNVVGAIDAMIKLEDALQLEIQATRAMIAIAQYKSQHGKYPVSLDDLIPDFVTDLPTDPINGGVLGYKLTSNDLHGRPYLIYSTGLDRKDDGGDFNAEDSLLCIVDPNAQTDYTVIQPRWTIQEYWEQHR